VSILDARRVRENGLFSPF